MGRWMVRIRRFPLACVLGILATACDGAVDPDGEITTLVVRGVIEDDTGTPVAGAVVDVGWKPGICEAELEPLPPDTTGTAGEFAVQAWSWGTHTYACVRVHAEPPAGSALRDARVQVDRVLLRLRDGPDTLAIRLTLGR